MEDRKSAGRGESISTYMEKRPVEILTAALGMKGLEWLDSIEGARLKSGNIKGDLSKIMKEGVRKTKNIITMIMARRR